MLSVQVLSKDPKFKKFLSKYSRSCIIFNSLHHKSDKSYKKDSHGQTETLTGSSIVAKSMRVGK